MKINIKKILIILLLLPFFMPAFFNYTGFQYLSRIYKILALSSFIISSCLYIKNNKIDKIIIFIFIFEILTILFTYINQNLITDVIYSSINIITPCMIADLYIKKDKNNFFSAISIIFKVLIYINFITILLFKDGMYTKTTLFETTNYNWFLGVENLHILYVLPGILFSYINSHINNEGKIKLETKIFIIISILSILLRKSATGILGISILIIYFIFQKFIDRIKIFNILTYFNLSITLHFSIVIFRIQEIFNYLIVNILGKNLTFTNRTYIWDDTIYYIKNKLLIGYGVESTSTRYYKGIHFRAFHAHNQFLEILYTGGICLFAVFMYIMYISFKELIKFKEEKLVKLISIIIFAFLIMMISESYDLKMIFLILVCSYNIKYLLNNKMEVNKK